MCYEFHTAQTSFFERWGVPVPSPIHRFPLHSPLSGLTTTAIARPPVFVEQVPDMIWFRLGKTREGDSRGWAHAKFANQDEATAAKKVLYAQVMKGRAMRVSFHQVRCFA